MKITERHNYKSFRIRYTMEDKGMLDKELYGYYQQKIDMYKRLKEELKQNGK